MESGNVRVSPDEMRRFVRDAFLACGLPDQDADTVAGLMVQADLRGADGHGVFRLPQYVRRLRAGGMNPRPQIRVVREDVATALVDGDNGMGHLVMSFAAETAIRKAKEAGVAWVGARNSNHAGPAALYAMKPLEHDMIGLYLAVGNANHMAPWGGVERLLSTNPIAIAVPCLKRPPLVLDMATTVVAYGVIKAAAQRGESIPEGWMIDLEGKPLTDPTRADEGLLLPIGNYKGYGLSLMFGVLAGLLNGAACGRDVVDFNHDDTTPTNTGQAMVAIDIRRFADVEAFKARVDAFIDEIKSSRRMPHVDEIMVPGEGSHRTLQERSVKGIPLNPARRKALDALAKELGIEPVRVQEGS